jgi:hypothetical protein
MLQSYVTGSGCPLPGVPSLFLSLGNKINADASSRSRFGRFARIIHFLLGAMFLWVFFYYLGQILLSLPSSFHEGTLWQMGWWKPQ